MGLTLKTNQLVFIDTAPIIYFFEENERYVDRIDAFLDTVNEADAQLVTSMITYIEILTMPTRSGDRRLAARYREFLTNSENVSIYPLNIVVADATVVLRATYKLRTPDAVQLAVAQVCGADVILTNDQAWKRVSGLNIVTVDEL